MARAQCRSATAATRTTLAPGVIRPRSPLHLGLEAAKALAKHAGGIEARQRRDALADGARRRTPPHHDVDASGSGAGGAEPRGAAVRDQRALDRVPGERAGRLA